MSAPEEPGVNGAVSEMVPNSPGGAYQHSENFSTKPLRSPEHSAHRNPLRSRAILASHSRSNFSFDGQIYIPLQPASTGWPQLGVDSASAVGPTAQKWASQQRHATIATAERPDTVVIRDDEDAEEMQTPWNAWLAHGEDDQAQQQASVGRAEEGGHGDGSSGDNSEFSSANSFLRQASLSPDPGIRVPDSPQGVRHPELLSSPTAAAEVYNLLPEGSGHSHGAIFGRGAESAVLQRMPPPSSLGCPKITSEQAALVEKGTTAKGTGQGNLQFKEDKDWSLAGHQQQQFPSIQRHSSVPASPAGAARDIRAARKSRSEAGDLFQAAQAAQLTSPRSTNTAETPPNRQLVKETGLQHAEHGRQPSMAGPVYMRPAFHSKVPSADIGALNLHEYFSPLSIGLGAAAQLKSRFRPADLGICEEQTDPKTSASSPGTPQSGAKHSAPSTSQARSAMQNEVQSSSRGPAGSQAASRGNPGDPVSGHRPDELQQGQAVPAAQLQKHRSGPPPLPPHLRRPAGGSSNSEEAFDGYHPDAEPSQQDSLFLSTEHWVTTSARKGAAPDFATGPTSAFLAAQKQAQGGLLPTRYQQQSFSTPQRVAHQHGSNTSGVRSSFAKLTGFRNSLAGNFSGSKQPVSASSFTPLSDSVAAWSLRDSRARAQAAGEPPQGEHDQAAQPIHSASLQQMQGPALRDLQQPVTDEAAESAHYRWPSSIASSSPNQQFLCPARIAGEHLPQGLSSDSQVPGLPHRRWPNSIAVSSPRQPAHTSDVTPQKPIDLPATASEEEEQGGANIAKDGNKMRSCRHGDDAFSIISRHPASQSGFHAPAIADGYSTEQPPHAGASCTEAYNGADPGTVATSAGALGTSIVAQLGSSMSDLPPLRQLKSTAEAQGLLLQQPNQPRSAQPTANSNIMRQQSMLEKPLNSQETEQVSGSAAASGLGNTDSFMQAQTLANPGREERGQLGKVRAPFQDEGGPSRQELSTVTSAVDAKQLAAQVWKGADQSASQAGPLTFQEELTRAANARQAKELSTAQPGQELGLSGSPPGPAGTSDATAQPQGKTMPGSLPLPPLQDKGSPGRSSSPSAVRLARGVPPSPTPLLPPTTGALLGNKQTSGAPPPPPLPPPGNGLLGNKKISGAHPPPPPPPPGKGLLGNKKSGDPPPPSPPSRTGKMQLPATQLAAKTSGGLSAINAADLASGIARLKKAGNPQETPAKAEGERAATLTVDGAKKASGKGAGMLGLITATDLASASAKLKKVEHKPPATGKATPSQIAQTATAASSVGGAMAAILKRAQDIRASFYPESTVGSESVCSDWDE